MHIFKLYVIPLLTFSIIGCSEGVVKPFDSVGQSLNLSQSDIDLMIEKSKADERARVQAEYAQQSLTASVFACLKKESVPEFTGQEKLNLPALAGNCLAQVVVPAQALSSSPLVVISKERLSYSTVVCKAHFTAENVTKLQTRLHDKGFLKSETLNRASLLNGHWDARTSAAMLAYQKDNRLAYGAEGVGKVEWTLETLRHLGLL